MSIPAAAAFKCEAIAASRWALGAEAPNFYGRSVWFQCDSCFRELLARSGAMDIPVPEHREIAMLPDADGESLTIQ